MVLQTNGELQRLLDKECQKSKRFCKQKCDLILAHEDELDEKDTEIAALQKQMQSNLLTLHLEIAHKVTSTLKIP